MPTNPSLLSPPPPPPPPVQGQYIKAVFPGEPADLAGMLTGDHVLEVDGTDVNEMSHMKVIAQNVVCDVCIANSIVTVITVYT